MGARCCCEETHEQSGTLVDLSQTRVEEEYNQEKDGPQPMDEPPPLPSNVDEGTPVPPESPPLAAPMPVPVAEVVATPIKQVEVDVIPQAAKTFTVEVEVSGRRLGFGIGHKHGLAAIEVVKVHEEGIIPEWNRIHYPEKQVVVGCKIVALNGRPIIAKDRDAMLSDITEAVAEPRLRMEIENP
mmetsp:Transcript_36470/g.66818  ORF Transcript_36470/g.66818 Transcript_36470/m.66818 type:complete len:184 (-) Transcript_36470:175-726(-)